MRADGVEAVVCIHGLWMCGPDMGLLRKRLRRCGFQVHQFHYRTISRSLADSAAALNDYVKSIRAERVHLVGHSMGGLLIRILFQRFPDQPPGHIVTLGTPHRGSLVARRLRQSQVGRRMLGRSAESLIRAALPWDHPQRLGSIAGSRPVGLGWVFARLPRPHDGTVAVAETRLEGMSDHLVLPVSHFGMLFSPEVAREVCHFLRYGRFCHTAPRAEKG